MVEVQQAVNAKPKEETTTQYIEYLFDDDQEDDWEEEKHEFAGQSAETSFNLVIRSRYSAVGVSRVSQDHRQYRQGIGLISRLVRMKNLTELRRFLTFCARLQSTWRAAYLMGQHLNAQLKDNQSWLAQMLAQKQADNSPLRVIELGSGTGLGGICISRLLELHCPGQSRQITMTDICFKALQTLKSNIELTGNLQQPELVQTQLMEWGNHEPEWIEAGSYDLIIASDVVYLPECVQPLIQSVSHLLKPQTGYCLFVNCMVRTGPYLGTIETQAAELGLNVRYEPDIIEHETDLSKQHKLTLFQRP